MNTQPLSLTTCYHCDTKAICEQPANSSIFMCADCVRETNEAHTGIVRIRERRARAAERAKAEVIDACSALTHRNGYREGQGHLWMDDAIIAILDAIGVDYRLTDVFTNAACEANRGQEL